MIQRFCKRYLTKHQDYKFGDFVDFRMQNRNIQGVVVSSSSKDQDKLHILTSSDSAIKIHKKKILISIPDWINHFLIPSHPQLDVKPTVPKHIQDEFVGKGFHPNNVTKEIFDFTSVCQKNLFYHISSFNQLYPKFNQMSNSDIKKLYIDLNTVSDFIHHSSNLKLDLKRDRLSEGYIISDILEKKSSLIELFSSYLFLCSQSNNYEAVNKSSNTAFQGTLFRVIPLRTSCQLDWLSTELLNHKPYNDLTYLQKNLGLESLPRGQAIRKFIEKLKSARSPNFKFDFSNEDLIFISVAKEVFVANRYSNSPILPLFNEISNYLMNAGVIPYNPFLRTNALDLLRLLKINRYNDPLKLEESNNSHPKPISISANEESLVDTIGSEMANNTHNVNSESLVKLISIEELQEQNQKMRVSLHSISQILGESHNEKHREKIEEYEKNAKLAQETIDNLTEQLRVVTLKCDNYVLELDQLKQIAESKSVKEPSALSIRSKLINTNPLILSKQLNYNYPSFDRSNRESFPVEKSILTNPPKKLSSVSNPADINDIYVFPKSHKGAYINNSDKYENLRTNVTNTVYVVDGPETKVFDDGFSIQSITDTNGNIVDYWFHVHVADPNTELRVNHPLTKIAQQKLNNLYIPDDDYDMPLYPSSFFGIKENGNSFTFSARINSQGDICDYKVSLSKLNKIKKLTYDEVDSVADWKHIEKSGFWKPNISMSHFQPSYSNDSKIQDHEIEEIKIAQALANKHLRFRVKNLAIFPDKLECSVKTISDPNSEAKAPIEDTLFLKVQSFHESPSYNLISEAMVIAGRVAAKFCHDRSVPVPYRGQISLDYDRYNLPPIHHSLSTHTNPDSSIKPKHGSVKMILDEAISSRNVNGVVPLLTNNKLIPFMHSASLYSKPISHFGMGIPGIDPISPQEPAPSQMIGYLQCTSPLRKRLDMIVLWQIKAELLRNQEMRPFNEEDIKKLSHYLLPAHSTSSSFNSRTVDPFINEWCRRREAIFSKEGVDPLSNPLMHQISNIGVGLKLYDWDKKTPIYREQHKYFNMPVSKSIVYTCLIGDTSQQYPISFFGTNYRVLQDCYIAELGSIKTHVLVSFNKSMLVREGDFIDVIVARADPGKNDIYFFSI